DVVKTLQKQFDKRALNVECVALINDTVSTLQACIADGEDCCVSFILNDGVNAVYEEKVTNIHRDDIFEKGAKTVLINTEVAGFGESGALNRFLTIFDRRFDPISEMPGRLRYEKLVGGLYQAEIVRQILYELTNLGQIFGGIWPEKLQDYKSLHPSFLCIIERDPPYLFYTTEFLLKEHYDIENLKAEDVYIVRYVCKAVVYRAACLTASGR
ncbi:unnamed protein product, partial [Hymenolepis diminuta]